MDDVIGDGFEVEFDPDYEFDASMFFDFSRPETDGEATDAEGWFGSAHEYPPSPFVVKLNWGKSILFEEVVTSSTNSEADEKTESISNNSDDCMNLEIPSPKVQKNGLKERNRNAHNIVKAKTKSTTKSCIPKSSTLMKPTASHLAKQNKAHDVNSTSRVRSQKPLVKVHDRGLLKSPIRDNLATKRQKLEIGYLRKVAQLKHQNSFSHKVAKKDTNSINGRPKVTVPKEPDLKTAQRAETRRSRSKDNSESGHPAGIGGHDSRARQMNRKVLNRHSLNPFLQSEDANFKRRNQDDNLKQEKCETVHKTKSRPLQKECKYLRDKTQSSNPPIELFKKLSLKSGSETSMVSQSKPHRSTKGSKENTPCSFHIEKLRPVGLANQCRSESMITEVFLQHNISRCIKLICN